MTARGTLYMSTNKQDQHDGEKDALHEYKQSGQQSGRDMQKGPVRHCTAAENAWRSC